MSTPKISIIIPAYNASNYLSEAIDSALAQTYPNVEIIVVNDGSKDDGATRAVALSYGDKIRYFEKENGGSSSALNTGVANMTGEWFSWLSHDDLYAPDKLEKQVACMQALTQEDMPLSDHVFFSESELINATGKTIRATKKGNMITRAKRVQSMPHNGHLIAQPTKYIFHGCSCLVHRNAFDQVGTFDEKLRLLNDVDYWFRLYAAGYKIHLIPEALVKGRVHAAQVSKAIGYSYHNPEQDMYWNRSLDWLMENHPDEDALFIQYAKNAYLKTRNAEGDRALAHIHSATVRKWMLRTTYKSQACVRNLIKTVYLKFKA